MLSSQNLKNKELVSIQFSPSVFTNVSCLVHLLKAHGFSNPYSKILIQGTGLHKAGFKETVQILKALAYLKKEFPFVEIFDPLLPKEGYLKAHGLSSISQIGSKYAVVLSLDKNVEVEGFSIDFYQRICNRFPVIIKAA